MVENKKAEKNLNKNIKLEKENLTVFRSSHRMHTVASSMVSRRRKMIVLSASRKNSIITCWAVQNKQFGLHLS